MNEQELRQSLDEYGVPDHMHGGITRYILQGIPPGDFLTAVICNDLMNALGRADDINREALFSFVNWFYNVAPTDCWKSKKNMQDWIEAHREVPQ